MNGKIHVTDSGNIHLSNQKSGPAFQSFGRDLEIGTVA